MHISINHTSSYRTHYTIEVFRKRLLLLEPAEFPRSSTLSEFFWLRSQRTLAVHLSIRARYVSRVNCAGNERYRERTDLWSTPGSMISWRGFGSTAVPFASQPGRSGVAHASPSR